MYASRRGNQGFPIGRGQKGGRGEATHVREITHTPSSIDTPVSGRLRCPREKKGAHSFHLSRRGEPGSGHITRESLNVRPRWCVSYRRMEISPVSVLEQSVILGPLIRVTTARFEGGLEKKENLLNWQQYIPYSQTFSHYKFLTTNSPLQIRVVRRKPCQPGP